MSCSSLYGINQYYKGEELEEYGNSWLFSPIIWKVLQKKYIPDEDRILVMDETGEVFGALNNKINNCDCTPDRICWELSNQQIFFTKDKSVVAEAIRQFLKDNKEYGKSDEDGKSSLEREHIIERFEEIAEDIEELDETEYPYFVLKNTSCDDGVERWFFDGKSLKDWDDFLAEFVTIKDGKISGFISNLKYEY